MKIYLPSFSPGQMPMVLLGLQNMSVQYIYKEADKLNSRNQIPQGYSPTRLFHWIFLKPIIEEEEQHNPRKDSCRGSRGKHLFSL
jgi:hypothetical protein